MYLIIDLQDHKNESHDSFQLELQDQATIKQLKNEIHSAFRIKPESQRIVDRNDRRIDLLVGSLEGVGIKDCETLVLKHAELPLWSTYCNYVEAVNKSQDKRVENAKRCVELHMQLMGSDFFNVYLRFDDYRLKHQAEVAACADGDLEMIAKAAENHFLLQHGRRGGTSEAGFEFSYEPRSDGMRGSRRGIIVDVKLHGEKESIKYSIKCHHYGTSSFSKGSPPSIIELFCYKLLELIKVGPAVQFIFPTVHTGSKTATYIATEWSNKFVRLSDILNENDFNIEALVQLCLLDVLLFIGDLHGDNCGQWSDTRKAAVVDLMPLPYLTHPKVKEAMFGLIKLKLDNVPRDLLEECPREEFWSIVKKCLDEWNLLSEIERAAELIVKEKDQMKALKIGFIGIDDKSKYTVTNELDYYLETIRSNVNTLLKELKPNE